VLAWPGAVQARGGLQSEHLASLLVSGHNRIRRTLEKAMEHDVHVCDHVFQGQEASFSFQLGFIHFGYVAAGFC
jgi:hypothetical protein